MIRIKKNTGDNIFKNNASWSFGGNVFKNFDKHIAKSVPLYDIVNSLYLSLTDYFLQDKSNIIDIGCSTGKFINKMHERHKSNDKNIKYIGVDNTKEMIKLCKKKYKKKKIHFFLKDVSNYKIKNFFII